MPSVYDIYERKNYRNKISLAQAVSFDVEVRETHLQIQAHSNLGAKAKDAVFRYRYQIEEYLRQHPAFRETAAPIQIYASAPEIVRYTDLASRNTSVPPMSCMSGAIADFVGRDLAQDSSDMIVSSGGDAYIRASAPQEVHLYAQGSPMHERLVLSLPPLKKCFGISTYVPNNKIHAVTVVSRSACWASAFAVDMGLRLGRGERLASVLDRARDYKDVGGIVLISGSTLVVCGDMILKAVNGKGPAAVPGT
ncbi:MAG TPA: hypothetical protein VK463_16690 [Desulfomonilaceae bacterium]|nr:hypothetical protein [Desulfomonilaceae bacterium]